MNRRKFLSLGSAGLVMGISGCFGNSRKNGNPATEEDKSGTDKNGIADVELRFAGVYADEVEREFIDYEYILLKNNSKDSLDISGYVIEYPSDREFKLSNLEIESGAQIAILSREGENTVLESSPPVYLQHAGFNTESDTSVLDKSGTIRVKNTHETIITSVSYENFGCDGGTVTTESGNVVDCLHGE